MPRKLKAELESMSAEAAWYASQEGRRQTQREFERALKRGAILRSEGSTIPLTHAKVPVSYTHLTLPTKRIV